MQRLLSLAKQKKAAYLFSMIRYLLRTLFLFAFYVLMQSDKHKVKKGKGVLFVRLDGLGDFIIWLDSLKAYRRLYPHDKFYLVALSELTEFALNSGQFSSVFALPFAQKKATFFKFGVLLGYYAENDLTLSFNPLTHAHSLATL